MQLLTLLRMAPWIAILLLMLALGYQNSQAKKWKGRAEYYHAELQRISTAKDEQRKETGRRIAEAEKNVRVVERVIRPLESKPIPPNPECRTPDLESWREVL